jgi:hypothetical protein
MSISIAVPMFAQKIKDRFFGALMNKKLRKCVIVATE